MFYRNRFIVTLSKDIDNGRSFHSSIGYSRTSKLSFVYDNIHLSHR